MFSRLLELSVKARWAVIAVTLIISPVYDRMWEILDRGGNSISALIALRFADPTPRETQALMAAGLALFLMTLLVNALASSIVSRSRSGAATEI